MSGLLQFDFTKDYILENHLVKLSPLSVEYVDQLANYAEETSIWSYLLEIAPKKESLIQNLEAAIQKRKEGLAYPFSIYDKRYEQYAGTTTMYEIKPDLGHLKLGHTWIGSRFQGTGLNKHCKYLLFEFIFETLGATRIGFGVHGENTRSIKAMQSVGVQLEGKLRDYLPNTRGDGRTDIQLFSILSHEWMNKVKTELGIQLKTKP